MTVYLIGCTETICDEVALGLTQKSIAITYAMALRSQEAGMDSPDWKAINTAILSRWKMSGLERIKKMALDRLSAQNKKAASHF